MDTIDLKISDDESFVDDYVINKNFRKGTKKKLKESYKLKMKIKKYKE